MTRLIRRLLLRFAPDREAKAYKRAIAEARRRHRPVRDKLRAFTALRHRQLEERI